MVWPEVFWTFLGHRLAKCPGSPHLKQTFPPMGAGLLFLTGVSVGVFWRFCGKLVPALTDRCAESAGSTSSAEQVAGIDSAYS